MLIIVARKHSQTHLRLEFYGRSHDIEIAKRGLHRVGDAQWFLGRVPRMVVPASDTLIEAIVGLCEVERENFVPIFLPLFRVSAPHDVLI